MSFSGLSMKIQTECLPCLLKRILFEAELSTSDKKRQVAAVRTACSLLAELYDPATCSAVLATQVHKSVYETLHDKDPYLKLKQTSNEVASSLVPKVEGLISTSADPLKTSLLCSIIGNIMDFGIEGSSSHPRMLEEVFDTLYTEGLGYDDYPKLRELLRKATRLMIFTDNCGEIVFDKLLCRELKRFNPRLHITAVVKGEPILSDATLQDAQDISLLEVVDEVYTTGCFAVGVDFSRLPREVAQGLHDADVIIAKGMANYESFSETAYVPIAYLLRVKCHAIAQSLGLPQNISVIKVFEGK
jgi:damage-control phosphatase, subfamily I